MYEHDEVTRVNGPGNSEPGCYVDWGWIAGKEIESAESDLTHWRVRFTDGQTLTIQASLYRGKPFLAFDPYKAPGG
jgi:hypothetical protein